MKRSSPSADIAIDPSTDGPQSMAIAIVGMEARFGSLKTLREFQEVTLSGRDDLRSAPAERWRGLERTAPFASLRVDGELPRGSYLSDVSTPIDRFRISPRELEQMLPQQLLMLDVVDRAIAEGDGRFFL